MAENKKMTSIRRKKKMWANKGSADDGRVGGNINYNLATRLEHFYLNILYSSGVINIL